MERKLPPLFSDRELRVSPPNPDSVPVPVLTAPPVVVVVDAPPRLPPKDRLPTYISSVADLVLLPDVLPPKDMQFYNYVHASYVRNEC